MFDRNSSYNRRPNQSSSYEEDDFLDAQDQQQRHSDRSARSRQSSRSERDPHANSSNQSNFKQAAQSAFGSLTSLASRYVGFGDSGSAAGGNHTRQAASRSRHEKFEYQDEDVESRSSGSRNSERSYRSDRGERAYREERGSRASRSHRSDRFGYSEHAGMRRPYEDEKSSGYVRHNDPATSSRYRQPRHVALADASYRRRNSSSMRESYGHALDYARHADNEERYEFGYDDYPRRDHRSGRPGSHAYRSEDRYGGSYSSGERRGRHAYHDDYGEYGSRYDERHESRGRHSSPDIYVRSGNNRGIFNGGFSLPFGIGSSSRFRGGYYRGNRGGASILSSLPLPVAYAVPVVILVLIIALLVFVVSSVQSCAAGGQNDQLDVQEVQPMNLSYQASVSGIDAIADPGATVTGFTLANEGQNYTPALSEEGLNSIQTALAPFVDNGYDIGFLLMDLQTGSGYVYNPDLEVYGASSFKGPVLIYGCQESLEPGILSIDSVNDSVSNAIIYSDNRSYYTMRATFEEYSEIGLVNWLANLGLDSSLESDSSFPHYSTRESAKLWMNAYLYFTSADSDPEIVSWAQDLFSQTEVSMIRAGVDPAFPLVLDSGEVYIHQTTQKDQSSDQGGDQNGENTEGNSGDQQTGQSGDQQADQSDDQNNQNEQQTDGQIDQSQGLSAADMADSSSNLIVYDKAGWLNGETDDGLCDAGIIYDGDKAYLISVMSGTPDGDDARQDLARLVAALWGQRSTLAPSQGYVLVDPAAPADQSNQTQQGQ